MAIVVLSKHVALLFIVVLIIGACSAHKGSRSRSRSKSRGYERQPAYDGGYGGNYGGYDNCYLTGGYACYGPGNQVQCYQQQHLCDGNSYCPFGDDEYNCNSGIRPSSTVFSTRTTTTTTTATTTTTTTTSSTSTTLLTSTETLAAVVPYKGTSSAITTTFTLTTTFNALSQIAPAAAIAANLVFCDDLQAVVVAGVAAVNTIVRVDTVTPTISFTATAHVSCMPSTTSYTML